MTKIKARTLTFALGDRSLGKFIEANHYSKTCPPSQHYFGAYSEGRLVGACVYRKPSLPKVEKAYGADIELVRLALIDEAGKNSESRFIGWTLRWLHQNTFYKRVVSFADPRFGHTGAIYRGANFTFLGKEKGHGTRRLIVDGVEYHSKSAFDKWGCSGAGLKKMLAPAKVVVLVCPPKNVYTYQLQPDALRANSMLSQFPKDQAWRVSHEQVSHWLEKTTVPSPA